MKITALTTFRIQEFPLSVFLMVETDAGVVGLGESTNQPLVTEAAIHAFIAPLVKDRNPLDIEMIWQAGYAQANYQGYAGAEMRALSALDIALWDILGKVTNQPVYRLLGGAVRPCAKVYNTCGSHGGVVKGRADDEWFMNDAGTLAEVLLKNDISAMKIWPLDPYAAQTRGQHITADILKRGFEPLEKIKRAVGDAMEIALECHSLWNLPAAVAISRAAEAYNTKWLEDAMSVDDVTNLAALKAQSRVPILASERLLTRFQYAPLLRNRAADIVMMDLGWTGGLTEGKKIAAMADTYALPVTVHNCGAGILTATCAHFTIATHNAIEMETVRAIYGTFPGIFDCAFAIERGAVTMPDAPGLGVSLSKSLLSRTDINIKTTVM